MDTSASQPESGARWNMGVTVVGQRPKQGIRKVTKKKQLCEKSLHTTKANGAANPGLMGQLKFKPVPYILA